MNKLSPAGCTMLLLLPFALFAQDIPGDQELSVSYGLTSGTDVINGFLLHRGSPSFDRGNYNSATSKTGDIFLTYRYFINRRLDIGITAGFEAVSFDNYDNARPPIYTSSYKATVTTIAAELKPVYYNGRIVQLYGLMGVGVRYYAQKEVAFYTTPENKVGNTPGFFFNSQWTPIGIRAGKGLSGFLELGFGYKGLINVGASYKLSRKRASPGKKG